MFHVYFVENLPAHQTSPKDSSMTAILEFYAESISPPIAMITVSAKKWTVQNL